MFRTYVSPWLALLTVSCTVLNSKDGLAGSPKVSDGDGASGETDGDNAGDGQGSSTDGSPGRDGSFDGPSDGADGNGGDGTTGDGADGAGGGGGGGDGADEGPGPWVVWDDLIEPRGITLRAGQVCWVAGTQPRGLYCGARDGSGDVQTMDKPDDRPYLDEAFDLTFDGDNVYWSNGPNNQVVRRGLNDASPEEHFTGAQGMSYMVQRGDTIFTITAYSTSSNARAAIVFGPYMGVMSQIIYPDEDYPAGIAVVNDVVYWGTNAPEGAQLAFGPDSGNAEVTRIDSPGPISGVAVDGAQTAYFIVSDQHLYKLRRGASSPELVYSEDGPFGQSDLTLDDGYLYWSEHDRGRIMRMAR